MDQAAQARVIGQLSSLGATLPVWQGVVRALNADPALWDAPAIITVSGSVFPLRAMNSAEPVPTGWIIDLPGARAFVESNTSGEELTG